jgi:pilus assembly protein CpaE
VIVVVSPKGGSGKTTVCANLAVGLAHVVGSTALVDLALQFGDVASALRLLPASTWAYVAKAGDIDATALKIFLTAHSSGLYALCAPDLPAHGSTDSGRPRMRRATVVDQSGRVISEAPRPTARAASSRFCTLG